MWNWCKTSISTFKPFPTQRQVASLSCIHPWRQRGINHRVLHGATGLALKKQPWAMADIAVLDSTLWFMDTSTRHETANSGRKPKPRTIYSNQCNISDAWHTSRVSIMFVQFRMCHWVWQKEVSEAYSSHVVICSSLIPKTPQEIDPVQPRAPRRIWANLRFVSFGVPLNLLNSSMDLWAWQWQALLRHIPRHHQRNHYCTTCTLPTLPVGSSFHLSSNPPRTWDEITGF